MALKRIVAVGTYDESMDPNDIDSFRGEKCQDWAQHEFSGTFVLNEGGTWLELEGEESKVNNEVRALLDSGFFVRLTVTDEMMISSKRLEDVYTYYSDRDPITSL